MIQSADNPKLLRVSQQWYQRLLVIYPRAHRAEYGPAMTQLFRDQCRDAWRDANWRGLLLLWLHILPDLLKTSCLEHFANLKGKKVMLSKISTGGRSSSAVRSAFVIVFLAVFVLVFSTSVIITLMEPEIYKSTARIKLERDILGNPGMNGVYDPYFVQTEFEVIQSERILDRVIDVLNLNEKWAKKYNSETKFRTSESRQALKRMIELRPLRNTSLIDISVYDEDKMEAAQIANTIVEVYQTYRLQEQKMLTLEALREVERERAAQGKKFDAGDEETRIAGIIDDVIKRTGGGQASVVIIEHAEPSARPVRPNVPLNIFLGGCIATLAGLLAGGLAAFVTSRLRLQWSKAPPPVPVIQGKY